MENSNSEPEISTAPTLLTTSVIIIGAGPAGASASIFLTKAGIHHIILEKEIFPRDKICGDACSGKTAFVLRKANPAWLDEVFLNTTANLACHGVVFASPNGKALSIPFSPVNIPANHAPGFMTTRLVFDNFLFEKIASPFAKVFQQASVKNTERKNGMIKVTFTQHGKNYAITAPLIIGADGDKSIIRKTFMNNEIADKAYCVGLRAYYKGVTGFHENGYIELHFLPEVLPGYLWIFPLPGGMANVGIGMLSDRIRTKKINLRNEMLNALKTNPNIKDRFTNAVATDKIQGWGLPMCIKREAISGENYLLAGDAASLIDPFTGEGIGNALYSGMLSAFAIEELIKANRFDAAFIKEKYDDVLYKRIGDELKMSALLQRLSRYPWLFNFVVKKAHKSHTLNTAITSMFTDIDLRKQLRKPSFYAKIIFNK
ncbi:MAG: geranylgeranyl reductase family protein [Ferruginibacter sp.]